MWKVRCATELAVDIQEGYENRGTVPYNKNNNNNNNNNRQYLVGVQTVVVLLDGRLDGPDPEVQRQKGTRLRSRGARADRVDGKARLAFFLDMCSSLCLATTTHETYESQGRVLAEDPVVNGNGNVAATRGDSRGAAVDRHVARLLAVNAIEKR